MCMLCEVLCDMHAGDVGQMNCGNRVSLGCDLPCVRDLETTVAELKQQNLEFAVMPLVHPRYRRMVASSFPRDTPFTRSDMILPSTDWTSHVVGRISEWINCDSPDEYTRANAVEALRQEARPDAAHHKMYVLLTSSLNAATGSLGSPSFASSADVSNTAKGTGPLAPYSQIRLSRLPI